MHTIVINIATGIVEIKIEGFWTLDDVAAFARDVREAARKVMQAGKRQSILYDYTNASIQSPEVIAALQKLAAENAFRSRKVALYTGGPMARGQAARIAAQGRSMKAFDRRETALAWLLAA